MSCLAAFRTAAEAPGYSPVADVAYFEASADAGGRIHVAWRTRLELGVEAFQLARLAADGATESAVSFLSLDNESGGGYEVLDPSAKAGAMLRYALRVVRHGRPEGTVAEWQGVPPLRAAALQAAPPAAAPAAPVALDARPWIGAGARVQAWTDPAPADRVRLSLRLEGLYRVTAAELAVAAGLDPATVAAALTATNLALSCEGQPVAWSAEGTNLYFYGRPPRSRFAPENVYWAVFGAGITGLAMSVQNPPPSPSPVTNVSFADMIVCQGTDYLARVSYSTLADSDAPYVAFGNNYVDFITPTASHGALIGTGSPASNSDFTNKWFRRIDIALPDSAPGTWTGLAVVRLLSFYEVGTDDHSASISMGGAEIGSRAWSGEQYVACTNAYSSTNLTAGIASLRVDNLGAPGQTYSRFIIPSCAVSYERLYRARDGALRCSGGTGDTVAVSGFATNDILALDVTDPLAPTIVATAALVAEAGAWTIAFPAGGADRAYAACSRRDGVRLPAVRGVRDVDWSDPAEAMDEAILIPPEAWRDGFRAALQPLADFRNLQGLAARIVDVESLYNRYSHGLADPQAIRAFATEGRANWGGRPLRYLLLAGAGALDYRHDRLSVNDYTACLIPTLAAGQRFSNGDGMTAAVDSALGDTAGDAAPEVAVGRFPTVLTQELAVAVQKTIAYEGAMAWKRQASICADWNNTGAKYYAFDAGTDRLVTPLDAAGRTVLKHYITDGGNASPARTSLFQALAAGSGILHYLGHTDEVSLGGAARLLNKPADFTPSNWQKPTVAVVVGCRINRWQSLTTTVCILPYGVFVSQTGFAAAIGATGFMLPAGGEDFGVAFHAAADGTLRLGDVLCQSLAQMSGSLPAEVLQCLSLTGDPALVLRHDVTAAGTDVAWLNAFGLTAPDADFGDPDADGWLTWQEFRAGTVPTNGQLRAASLATQPESGRLSIAFDGAAAGSYAVQRAPAPGSAADWQPSAWAWPTSAVWQSAATPIPASGPRTSVDVPLVATNRQEFFRLVVP
jgi:hypothetical protein